MPATYLWLRQILAQLLPELENLPAGPQGAAQAQAWFKRLLARFEERGLKTPAQQKNRVVDARNAIRDRFGADHPALAYVGFDESTWQQINLPTHDRTEARNENQRLLRQPEKIVARAARLLLSPRFEDLAVGLGLTVGRRISELLDAHARLEAATPWSVLFTGQRKHRGERETFAFEIPTLAPAETVLAAWARLQVMLGDQPLSPQDINHRYGHAVNQAADHHFRGLVPPRLPRPPKGKAGSLEDPLAHQRPKDALYLHLFRAVYATIAVHWFCPPRVNRLVYKAEIQGHRQILGSQGALRRAYTASRHYDDYQIADASGENLDGRQGIKLGRLPGLEVLSVFQTPPPTPPETIPLPQPSVVPEEGAVSPAPAPATPPPPATMDPATPTDPILDPSPGLPLDTPPDGGVAPEGPQGKPAKKPRPITYRLYPADRPRLDAFRTDPKQSQADNLHQVIERVENASAAIQAQEQSQAQLQEALARAEQTEAARDQAHQEAQGLREEAQGLRERVAAQAQEIQRLQAALAQAQARAAVARAAGGGSPVAQAVLARELLNLATEEECRGELQGRLIALATQALGGSAGGQPHLEKRQDGAAGLAGPAKADGGSKKAARASVDERRFGPLFAVGVGAGAGQETGGPGAGPTPEKIQAATPTQEDVADGGAAMAQEPAAVTDTTDQRASDPVDGLPTSSDGAAEEAQEPPGASETPLAPPTASRAFTRRGGASEKLERALQAVLAHNDAQTSREKKWAVTESALARLTGCFRPAVRAFFAGKAEEIEAHNHKHHLVPGLNAARGRRDQQIEEEVHWRGVEGAVGGAEGTADQEGTQATNA